MPDDDNKDDTSRQARDWQLPAEVGDEMKALQERKAGAPTEAQAEARTEMRVYLDGLAHRSKAIGAYHAARDREEEYCEHANLAFFNFLVRLARPIDASDLRAAGLERAEYRDDGSEGPSLSVSACAESRADALYSLIVDLWFVPNAEPLAIVFEGCIPEDAVEPRAPNEGTD